MFAYQAQYLHVADRLQNTDAPVYTLAEGMIT
jgi:hypothetical protein